MLTAGWPDAPAPDPILRRAGTLLDATAAALRAGARKAEAPPKAKKGAPAPAKGPKVVGAAIHTSAAFSGWHAPALAALAAHFDDASRAFDDGALAAALAAARPAFVASGGGDSDKALKAGAAPFLRARMAEAAAGGSALLEARLPFDEAGLYRDNAAYLARVGGVPSVTVVDGPPPDGPPPLPGAPALRFSTEAAEGEGA